MLHVVIDSISRASVEIVHRMQHCLVIPAVKPYCEAPGSHETPMRPVIIEGVGAAGCLP